MAWDSSRRRQELPPNWWAICANVKRRDKGICQKCGAPGTDVDHVIPGGSDDEGNLQLLCSDCHSIKSSAEGRAAKARLKAITKRKPERHPGWVPPAQRVKPKNIGF